MLVSCEKQVDQLNIADRDKEIKIAKKPNYGKRGRIIQLKSNYFKVSKFPRVPIYHYNFEHTPRTNKKTVERIYVRLAEENRFCNCHAVFDGNNAIYSATPLPIENARRKNQFKVRLTKSNGKDAKVGTYNVTIRFIQLLNFNELEKHISGGNSSLSEVVKCIASLNTYINFSVRQKYLTVGRGIYPDDPREKSIILSGGFELKKGFCHSLRAGENCLAINVDVCASVFYLGGKILDVACRILGKHSKDEFHRGMTKTEIMTLLKAWVKIISVHREQRKPINIVKDLTKEPASRIIFYYEKEKRKISIAEYFHLTYGRKLEFEELPCVAVNQDVFLPLEVCEILKGQRFGSTFADTTLADVIRHTCIKPKERFNRISYSVKEVFQYQRDPFLKSINMNVESCN
ncbi:3492_t:CDS:2, partial [Acaulospora morrowiae]